MEIRFLVSLIVFVQITDYKSHELFCKMMLSIKELNIKGISFNIVHLLQIFDFFFILYGCFRKTVAFYTP